MDLADAEGLDAHRNAVALRLDTENKKGLTCLKPGKPYRESDA